jgi:hypothetical protein
VWAELLRILRFLFTREPKLAGPALPPPSTVDDMLDRMEVNETCETWERGWWYENRQPAHAGRIGSPIVPRAVVVHTTDTLGGYTGMVKRLTTEKGAGSCCHFMIDRDGHCTQFVPITRNGNHAGGKVHGNWAELRRTIHPNSISVGIELVGGGKLKQRKDGTCYHPDSGKDVPLDQVYWDVKNRPWHKITEQQLYTLRKLLDDLRLVLKPLGPAIVEPDDDYKKHGVDYFAHPPANWLVGHVSLDPINKQDPGPQIMTWLKEYLK